MSKKSSISKFLTLSIVFVVLSAILTLNSFAVDTLSVANMNTGLSATTLAQAIVGPNVPISNATYVGDPISSGTVLGGQNIIGIDSGVVLTNGSLQNIIGPNDVTDKSYNNGRPGDTSLAALIGGGYTTNASILEFDIKPNTTSTITFQYVFMSEEYNEFVGSTNDDVFGLFVDGQNKAFAPGYNRISINTINKTINSPLFIDNTISPQVNTQMDGFTTVQTITVPVIAGTTYHIKIGIADVQSPSRDSAVVIKTNTNKPPIAEAGANITTAGTSSVGANVTLNGTASSDPDGDALTYTWTGPFGTATGSSLTVSMPVGTNIVTLTVSDGKVSAQDTVSVTVTAPIAPIAEAGPNITNTAASASGASVTLNGSGSSNPAGTALTYLWTWTVGTTNFSAAGVSPTVTMPVGVTNVTLTVSNNILTATDTMSVTIYKPVIITASNVSAQYSDVVAVSATLKVFGAALANKSVNFTINGVAAGSATTNSSGIATLSYKNTNAKGSIPVVIAFNKIDSPDYLLNTSINATLTSTVENATIAYTGNTSFTLPTKAVLMAKVTESADGSLGNLTNAKVNFSINKTVNGTTTNVGSVQATCDASGNASAEYALDAGQFNITASIIDTGYYTVASAASKAITVIASVPTGSCIGNGTYFSPNICSTALFNVNASLKLGVPSGSMSLLYPKNLVFFTSNKITSLSVSGSTATVTATGSVVGKRGTYLMVFTVIDSNSSTVKDTISIRIYTGTVATGTPIYQADGETLSSGNVVITK